MHFLAEEDRFLISFAIADAELDDQELGDELKDLENPGVEAKEEGKCI